MSVNIEFNRVFFLGNKLSTNSELKCIILENCHKNAMWNRIMISNKNNTKGTSESHEVVGWIIFQKSTSGFTATGLSHSTI